MDREGPVPLLSMPEEEEREAVRPMAAEAFDTARFTLEYEPPATPLELKLDQKTYYVSERALRASVVLASPLTEASRG